MRLSLLQMFGIVAIAVVIASGMFSPNLTYVAAVSFFVRLLIILGIAMAIASTPHRKFWIGFVATTWFMQQFGSEPIFEAATAVLLSYSGRPVVGGDYSNPNSPDAMFEMAYNGPSLVYRTLVHNTLSLMVGILGGLISTLLGQRYAKQPS